jgi:hypothetical protein
MPPGMEGMPPGMEGMPPGMEGMGEAPMPPGLPPEIQPGLLTQAGGPIQGPGAQPGVGALPASIQSLPPEVIEALLSGGQ